MKSYSCNYLNYYSNQSGGKFDEKIVVYKGRAFQRGAGIFSKLRYTIPYLKNFGREVLDLGKNILFDVASGENVKQASQKHLKRKASSLLKQAAEKVEQYGTGRKRRKFRNNNKKTKSRKRIKIRKHNKNKSLHSKRRNVKQRLKSDIFK